MFVTYTETVILKFLMALVTDFLSQDIFCAFIKESQAKKP